MNFYTPPEAAIELHLSTSTLAKYRLSGAGPTYRKHGRSVVYEYSDLENWSRSRTRTSTSDQGFAREAQHV